MYYAVIMAGGTGTRLWPLSREKQPKQALRLVGNRTMFQHAVDRLAPLFPPDRVLVVTRQEHADLLHAQVPELPEENFILEPEGRGTAPAIALVAIHLQKRDPEAVMAVLTADHFISDTAGFRQALAAAEVVARRGYLVTLGIQPTSPSTGYGYIQQGKRLDEAGGLAVYQVNRFVEKPDLPTAVQMVTSGQYAWNSGMFIWQVGRVLQEFATQMPVFSAQLQPIAAALGSPAYEAVLAATWPTVAKETIDYGIMEKARNVAVIPVSIGWVDVGSWASLDGLLPPDGNGNIWTGPHVDIDTQNTLVFMEQPRLAATIGIQGLVIVDTPDALLVCTKEREQEVRAIVKRLQETGSSQWL